MDIILNDLSVNNQFSDYDDFNLHYKKDLLPLFILLEKISRWRKENYSIYKNSNFYLKEIYSHVTMQQLLQLKGKAVVQQLLVTLTFNKQPFWDLNLKTKQDDDISTEYPIPSCITEAFYRQICLISFPKSNFTTNIISIIVNGNNKNVYNAIERKQFIQSFPFCYGIEIKPGQEKTINDKTIKFEIRDNEGGEVHKPHFHLTETSGRKRSSKIKIDDNFELIKGSDQLRRECLSWCKENYFIIKVLWNYRHGDEHKIEE